MASLTWQINLCVILLASAFILRASSMPTSTPSNHDDAESPYDGVVKALSTSQRTPARTTKIPRVTFPPRVGCSNSEALTVQREWDKVFNAGDGGERRLIIVTEIFKTMFSSPTFKAHLIRLLTDLNSIVEALHDNNVLEAQLNHLSYKRSQYMGAHVGYYGAMNKGLMTVLPKVTGEFDKLAWTACLDHVGKGLAYSRQLRAEQQRKKKQEMADCEAKRQADEVGGLTPATTTPVATTPVATTLASTAKPMRRGRFGHKRWRTTTEGVLDPFWDMWGL